MKEKVSSNILFESTELVVVGGEKKKPISVSSTTAPYSFLPSMK